MRFVPSEEQAAFAGAVRDVLRDHCPPAALRAERRPAWERLAAIGFFGVLVPAGFGGLGLGLADFVGALEETGRACLPGPVVETAVAAPYLLDDLAKVASGSMCVSVQPPGQAYAPDADMADLLVVARADGVRLVSGQAVRLTARPGADPCRRLFEVAFDESVEVGRSPVPAVRGATVATAAQLIGVARHLLAASVEYARARRQFGAAIGSFQAVKHRLADVAVAIDFAAPLVHRAALSVDRAAAVSVGGGVAAAAGSAVADHAGETSSDGMPPAGVDRAAGVPLGGVAAVTDLAVERDVSAAKAAAGEAAGLAARVALQTHGAIGYTDEFDLRFWLARAWSLSAAYGTSALHRAVVRDALLGGDLRRYP